MYWSVLRSIKQIKQKPFIKEIANAGKHRKFSVLCYKKTKI